MGSSAGSSKARVSPPDLAAVTDALSGSISAESVTRLRGAAGADGRLWTGGSTGSASSASGGFPSSGGGLGQADLLRIGEMMEMLRRLMFPGFFDPEPGALEGEDLKLHIGHLCARVSAHLVRQVRSVFRYTTAAGHGGAERVEPGGGGNGAGEQLGGVAKHTRALQPATGAADGTEAAFGIDVAAAFMSRLVAVREMLSLDVQAAYDGDPAAEHTDEVVLCYPGLDAIFAQRIAHELYELGVPILPRIISEQAHSRTGIDVHPGAKIGRSFFIDHGSGTVIGETSVIGEHVKVYQGVTLGARSFPKDDRGRVIRGIKRHPTIGNRVNIYAGAVILGGDTVIGDDCVIAGGVFVTSSVPPGHVVQQPRAELILRPNQPGRSGGASAGGGGAGGRSMTIPAGAAGDVGWLGDGAGI